jgi:hypothetical protein
MRRGSNGYATISAGLSHGTMDTCPDGTFDCSFLGIPLVAEAAYTTRFIGFGIQAFVTLNGQGSFGGVALFIPLGWMP